MYIVILLLLSNVLRAYIFAQFSLNWAIHCNSFYLIPEFCFHSIKITNFPKSYKKENIMHGTPQIEASAMVPGPALVTSVSEARIYSSML